MRGRYGPILDRSGERCGRCGPIFVDTGPASASARLRRSSIDQSSPSGGRSGGTVVRRWHGCVVFLVLERPAGPMLRASARALRLAQALCVVPGSPRPRIVRAARAHHRTAGFSSPSGSFRRVRAVCLAVGVLLGRLPRIGAHPLAGCCTARCCLARCAVFFRESRASTACHARKERRGLTARAPTAPQDVAYSIVHGWQARVDTEARASPRPQRAPGTPSPAIPRSTRDGRHPIDHRAIDSTSTPDRPQDMD